MTKKIILGVLLFGSYLFAAQIQVPEAVEKELNKSARTLSGSDRVQFINWQKTAYIQLEQIAKESGLPEVEIARIQKRLHQMYGSNYRKQLQVIDDEISDYKELVRRVQEQNANVKPDEATNTLAQRELTITLANTTIPKEILDIYSNNAKELYPGNYVAQKKYMEYIISNFNKVLEWIKNNKSILN